MTEFDGQKPEEQQLNTRPDEDPFQAFVAKQIAKVVEMSQPPHPQFQPTRVTEIEINTQNQQAAFILFEQIDVDAFTGDQFRYSVWIMEAKQDPQRIYEDHAYIRSSVSLLTGSTGRDCRLHSLSLKGDLITVQNAAGQTLNLGKESI